MAKSDGWLKKEIDNFVDAFKEIIKKEPEQKKQTAISNEQKENNARLIAELKALEAKYNERNMIAQPDYDNMFEDTLGLVKKEVPQISDEELRKQAETLVKPDYEEKINKVESTIQKGIDKVEDKIENAEIKYSEDKETIEQTYSNLLDRQKRAMIKQGIVNSSIFSEGRLEIESDKVDSLSLREQKQQVVLSSYNKEIERINLERTQALREYELNYAADLELKTIELTKKRDALIKDINTYNEKIIKQEANYQKYREESIQKLEEDRYKKQAAVDKERAEKELVTGYTGAKAQEMNQRYNRAIDFYNKLPKDVALALIKQEEGILKSALGLYYGELVTQQQERRA